MKEITIGDKPLDNQWDAFVAIEVVPALYGMLNTKLHTQMAMFNFYVESIIID